MGASSTRSEKEDMDFWNRLGWQIAYICLRIICKIISDMPLFEENTDAFLEAQRKVDEACTAIAFALAVED